ncbi:MAG: PAS domain S-box protein [Methanomicrobiales archaeon]|nr:PAS domain S-box protein [Methanomicrobiales archaeon]
MIQRWSIKLEEIMRLFIMVAACIGAFLTTIFSLTHGVFEVFSFLYILPIILCVYFYPRQAVYFTLGISLVYLGLIYLFGYANHTMIAVATAWFAIFMTIGIVASSYARRMLAEQERIRNILENSQDGIICFDQATEQILEINPKCARWLRYDTQELQGKDLSAIWQDTNERNRFLASVTEGRNPVSDTEGLFRAKDGTLLRFTLSVVLVLKGRVYCSVIDITGSKIVDEEIRRTLEDLEAQVKARTAHLEQINEELRAEILERRKFEQTIIASQAPKRDDVPEDRR